MKRSISIILAIIFILTQIGCSQATKNASVPPDTSLSSVAPESKKYTKDDAIASFISKDDFNRYEILECVLKDDDKVPILKAVISFYDKQKNNSCNLAFILDNSVQEISFAVNEVEGLKTFEIVDGIHLAYIGNGTVTTAVRKIETGEIINFKVIFSYEESTNKINFKVISEKA